MASLSLSLSLSLSFSWGIEAGQALSLPLPPSLSIVYIYRSSESERERENLPPQSIQYFVSKSHRKYFLATSDNAQVHFGAAPADGGVPRLQLHIFRSVNYGSLSSHFQVVRGFHTGFQALANFVGVRASQLMSFRIWRQALQWTFSFKL